MVNTDAAVVPRDVMVLRLLAVDWTEDDSANLVGTYDDTHAHCASYLWEHSDFTSNDFEFLDELCLWPLAMELYEKGDGPVYAARVLLERDGVTCGGSPRQQARDVTETTALAG